MFGLDSKKCCLNSYLISLDPALLGVKRYDAHLNGYTWRNDEMHMWLARRALNKPTYPGLLDNLVRDKIG